MQNTNCILILLQKDVFKQATEDRLTSAKELPYFEGDFWPNVLEESIKELEQEEEERKREENSTSNESIDVRTICQYDLEDIYCTYCILLCGRGLKEEDRHYEKRFLVGV